MDDAPAAGAQNLTHLFQTNSRAIKAERRFDLEKVRANSVAVLMGDGWGYGGS